MNYFEYNGTRSDDMGLRIESKNVFSAPKYDAKFTTIPGRDGELIVPNYRYPNVQVTYTVFVPAKSISELSARITAIKAWLYTEPDRYHELREQDRDIYGFVFLPSVPFQRRRTNTGFCRKRWNNHQSIRLSLEAGHQDLRQWRWCTESYQRCYKPLEHHGH